MLRAAEYLFLALSAASAQRLYIDATPDELSSAVPELAALQSGPSERSDELPRVAAQRLDSALERFADVSAAERINEMRFDGGVAGSSRVENYRYCIRATLDGGPQLFTEFRIDPKTGTTAHPPEVIQFLALGNFMQTLSYLMPQYLSRSTFRYLGTVGSLQVLAFARKPGEVLPRGNIVTAAGAAPLQGLLWLDSSNRIVRLRTDLIGTVEGFPLETATADIVFAPVTFTPGSEVFWLPRQITEHARFAGGEFHSVHRFSDYRSESHGTVGSLAEANEPDAYELTIRGLELAQAGKADAAVVAWRKALNMESHLAAAHFALGSALRTSDPAASAAELGEAAKLAPGSALVHNALGVVLSHQGDAKGAAEEYRRAIAIVPKQAVTHFNLAQALEKLSDRAGALAEYRAAAGLAPDNASFQARLNAFQQAEPQTTIKVDVRQVLVPVVVTDQDGHRVTGLKREDFRVFEDGVEQKLAGFSVEDAQLPDQTPPDAVGNAPTPGKPPAPAAAPIRRTYAICIDALHSDFGNMVRVRQAIRKLFETERGIDTRYLALAIGTSTQILVNLTNDPKKVLEAVDSKEFQRVFMASRSGSTREEMRQFIRSLDEVRDSCDHGLPDCDPGKRGLPHRADAIERQERIVNMSFLDQLRNLVQQLARGHERRTVVMFSDGFQPFPGKQAYDLLAAYFPVDFGFMRLRGVEPLPDLEQVTRLAANNNIPFYTIDSRGLYTSGFYDASGGGTASRMAPAVLAATTAQETDAGLTLSAIAADTGGVAYHNSNDLFSGLQRAFADGRQYYMLAYVPSNAATDGKFRAIAVRLRNEKLKTQTKKGYWAQSP